MYEKIVSHDTSRKDFLVKAGLAGLCVVPAIDALYRRNYGRAMQEKIIIQGRRDLGWQVSVDHAGNLFYRKMQAQDLTHANKLADGAKLAAGILKINPALAISTLGLAGLGERALEKLGQYALSRRDLFKKMLYVSSLMYLISCGGSTSDDKTVVFPDPGGTTDPADPGGMTDPTDPGSGGETEIKTHATFLSELDDRLTSDNILDPQNIIQLGTQMPEESFNIFNSGATVETSPAAMAQMFLRLKSFNTGHVNRLAYYYANGALTEPELNQMQDKEGFLPGTFKTMIDSNYIGNQEMYNKLLAYAYYYSRTGTKPPYTTEALLENGVMGTEYPLLLLVQAMNDGDNVARGLYWAYLNQDIYDTNLADIPSRLVF